MSEMVTFTVDGQTLEAPKGAILLPVLLEHGFEIPHYCYHDALGADGNCRMCMVEIEGKKRPQISCDTFVEEGLVVRTNTEEIRKVRQSILELQLVNHPVDCPVCDQAGECSLQDYYMEYGLYHGKVDRSEKIHFQKHLDLGRSVVLDQERCVLCQRCTRFTADITQTHELGVIQRADHSVIDTMPGEKLHNDYAMNVVDLCPVGALTSKDFRFKQRVWFLESSPSVCHGCARGCAIHVDHARLKYEDDTIYRFRPRKNPAINGHFICDAGRLSYHALQENRCREARYEGRPLDLEEAAEKFREKIENHSGPLLVLADANLYNEELELARLYAERIGAEFAVPLEPYLDESFGDDWLKLPMRAANAEGVRRLGISTEMPKPEAGTLIVNFNHPAASGLGKERIDLLTHTIDDAAELTLPLAPWTESFGTLVNADGIAQTCDQVIHPNDPVPPLLQWLEAWELGERCLP